MKKAIIACLAFISLVSCSNNNKIEQPVKTAATEAATAELTTEAEIPPATEPETIELVLHDDDNCTITYNNFKSLDNSQRIYLTIDNKNDNSFSAHLSELKINGISIDEYFGQSLKSKESASNCISIPNSKLQKENITRVNSIEFKLQLTVTDKTNGDCLDYYYTDTMTITR